MNISKSFHSKEGDIKEVKESKKIKVIPKTKKTKKWFFTVNIEYYLWNWELKVYSGFDYYYTSADQQNNSIRSS
jgi:hypothetical protein